MLAKVFLKGLTTTAFEQDVKVTESVERNVKIVAGDEMIVEVYAKVATAVEVDGVMECELRDVQPYKIVSVNRVKKGHTR